MDRRPAGESLPPPSECPQNQSVLPSQRAPRTVQVVGTDGVWPSLRARSRSLRSCHDSCPPVSASRHCAMGSRPRGGTAQTRARLQPPRSRTLPAPHVQSSCLVLSLLLWVKFPNSAATVTPYFRTFSQISHALSISPAPPCPNPMSFWCRN